MCKAKFRMINRAEVHPLFPNFFSFYLLSLLFLAFSSSIFNVFQIGKDRKPKRVRVSDVDQRAEYSDPDPDDFLTYVLSQLTIFPVFALILTFPPYSDDEDSVDDLIFNINSLLAGHFGTISYLDLISYYLVINISRASRLFVDGLR